jgi:hypothetical protein
MGTTTPVEERIDAAAELRRTYAAMQDLSEPDRRLLELIAVDGLSAAEAARAPYLQDRANRPEPVRPPPTVPPSEPRHGSALRGQTRPTDAATVADMAQRYEYKVIELLREGLISGKVSGSKLQNALNEHASQGWQLRAVTAVEVNGLLGPGGVEGVLVTFERQIG